MKHLLAKILRKAKEQRLSQRQLMIAAGCRPEDMSRWKGGEGFPGLSHAWRISRVLGVSLDWLCDDAQLAEPKPALSDDEKAILGVIQALGLSKDEVLRRLYSTPKSGPVTWHGGGTKPIPTPSKKDPKTDRDSMSSDRHHKPVRPKPKRVK